MSDQNPPGTPGEGPDPFAELLKGLQDEPAPASSADQPTVAFPLPEQPASTSPEQPTVAFAAPAAAEPIPAAGAPSAGDLPPTVAMPGTFAPTAATTLLTGGSGGTPPGEPPTRGGFRDWDPRRKALFITLISAAGVLLIALIVLLIVLLSPKCGPTPGPSPSPTKSVTPSPTPTKSATPTPTPTPTPTAEPAIQSFTVTSNTAQCADTGAGTIVTMHFAWTVVNSTQLAIASGPAAVDAIANPYQNNLPATVTDFQMPFSCSNGQLTYSLTAAGADNQHYSGVLTVVRQVTPPPPTPSLDTWTANPTTITCPADPTDPIPTVTLTWGVSNWQNGSYLSFGIGSPTEVTRYTTANGSIISSDGTSPGDFPEIECDPPTDQQYFLTLYNSGGQQLGQKSLTVGAN